MILDKFWAQTNILANLLNKKYETVKFLNFRVFPLQQIYTQKGLRFTGGLGETSLEPDTRKRAPAGSRMWLWRQRQGDTCVLVATRLLKSGSRLL